MADRHDLAVKAVDELDELSLPLVSGTDSLLLTRGGKPFTVALDDFIGFIALAQD